MDTTNEPREEVGVHVINDGEQPNRYGDNMFHNPRWREPTAEECKRLKDERIRDSKALEDAMGLVYPGAGHTKLAATIMVVNLVATHSCIIEKAAD